MSVPQREPDVGIIDATICISQVKPRSCKSVCLARTSWRVLASLEWCSAQPAVAGINAHVLDRSSHATARDLCLVLASWRVLASLEWCSTQPGVAGIMHVLDRSSHATARDLCLVLASWRVLASLEWCSTQPGVAGIMHVLDRSSHAYARMCAWSLLHGGCWLAWSGVQHSPG